MRCLACGAEMRLIQAAPDETTMFAGYEQYTFECSGCRLHVRQLVSNHEIGPFAEERMRLPPGWLKNSEHGRIDSSRLGTRSIEPLRLDRRILHLMASWSRLNLYRRDNHHDCISRFINNMGRRERTDG